ncbi:MAG: hopanoid biosynthesis-associated protein HpnK [Verrucomicrobiales bacterium]
MASANRRRLIINADDFGRSSSINHAVIDAHKNGILTTASLMVNGDAVDEAVALAKENPALGVGLHLSLVCGKSTLTHERIPMLVDNQNRFSENPVAAGMQYFFQTAARFHLEQEIEAQFARFHETGLPLDHVNGHLHFHLHPSVFKLLQPSLIKWKVRAMRLTYEPWEMNLLVEKGRWAYRISHAFIFSLLSRRVRPFFEKQGIACADQVFGLLQNAMVDKKYLLRLLPDLPAGTSEIYSHPSLDEFRNEYEALIDPEVVQAITNRNIELIRYQDLCRSLS